MDSFIIKGQNKLQGTVKVSGAKNAILPIMIASLLTSGKSILTNVPSLNDLKNTAHLLRFLGAKVETELDQMAIDTVAVHHYVAPYELVNKMRASIYVLGPLLARFKYAEVALPGGCAIGTRPVDLHLMAMEKLGAKIKIEHGYISAECPDGLRGGIIEFPFITVGATANCLMAAVLAKGETLIKNTAQEPDIDSLIDCLILMGAKIEKINKNDLHVIGVDELKPFTMEMIPDRIEAGTLLLAAAITKSSITITNCEPNHLEALLIKMEQAGCRFEISSSLQGDIKQKKANQIKIHPAVSINPVDIVTEPYPGFPTDLQAQFLAYLCLARGKSHIKETIFPDRFMHVSELNRLGADIHVKDGMAIINGVSGFSGAEVMATDLRASATLVLAGLAAEGTTKISRIYHIDRGYEKIEQKLNNLGADIKRC
ncbi:MAG: UDP-N-acetylglucosamine 1-carboxyvinyltransferase [Candidatus Cloacimonetes bacterium]|nr:UDP-N-acetylglucosamine 1-carboxyvinyltransferase [Candidatus Cloacimonadota bacterium]